MAVPEGVLAQTREESGLKLNGKWELVAEARANSNAFTSDGATTVENGSAGLGLHTRAEAVSLHTVAAIGLKCALGHGIALLFPRENLRLDGKT
jgi:hypothetical protein